jgi:hypothetical protein
MLTVFLDTSDYVALYRDNLSLEMLAIRNKLFEFVDSRKIRIGFSYLILFELLQDYSPEYLEDRRKRARLVSRLCGANCFPYVTDLLGGQTFSDDGIWMPRETLKDLSFSYLQQKLKARILNTPRLNRVNRRKYSNSKVFANFLKNNPDAMKFTMTDIGELPVPESFIEGQYFRKYFLGEISLAEADKELRKFVTDPECFFEFWFQYYGKTNPLNELLRAAIDNMKTKIEELQTLSLNFKNTQKGHEEELSKFRKFESEAASLERDLGIRTGSSRVKIPKMQKANDLIRSLERPAISQELPEHIRKLVWEYFLAFIEPRKFLNSDIADIIHAFNIEHCDLWRGDQTFCKLLMNSKISNKDRIVSSLRDLPNRIESALSA